MSKSCSRMESLVASSRLLNPISRTCAVSDSNLASTILEATNIPNSEPIGLKAWARLRRRVEVSLLPNDKM